LYVAIREARNNDTIGYVAGCRAAANPEPKTPHTLMYNTCLYIESNEVLMYYWYYDKITSSM
jgi:hypothetical protein